MHNSNGVTLVVTACGRPDLLKRTLESFAAHNTYPLEATIIAYDGDQDVVDVDVNSKSVTHHFSGERVGQIALIDQAYDSVRTSYIFHCEDDWEFFRPGFIEESLAILDAHENISNVWLRERDDTMGHPIESRPELPFDLLTAHYGIYHGFSFNPGLRRMSDYWKLGRYTDITPSVVGKDWVGEAAVGEAYFALGYRAAITRQGYVRHIGWDRSVVS